MQVANEVRIVVDDIYCLYVVPRYGRSQIWAYIDALGEVVVLTIEPRKGDAIEIFRGKNPKLKGIERNVSAYDVVHSR